MNDQKKKHRHPWPLPWTEITVPFNSFTQYSITEDDAKDLHVKLQPEHSNKSLFKSDSQSDALKNHPRRKKSVCSQN